MSGGAILVATTLVKLAAVGGVGIAVSSALKWFHTYEVSFSKRRNGGVNYDNDDFEFESKRARRIS